MAEQGSLMSRMLLPLLPLLRPLLRPIVRRVLPRVLPPTALGPADLFREIHFGLFDREPSPEALAAYSAALGNRTLSIRAAVAELRPAAASAAAPEFTAEDLVRRIYLGLFGREPDRRETHIYAEAFGRGLPLEQAISELGRVEESRRRFAGPLLPREELLQVAVLVETVLQQRLRAEGVDLKLPSAAEEADPLRILAAMQSALLALTAEAQPEAQLATSRA